jgi:hypothetical protein
MKIIEAIIDLIFSNVAFVIVVAGGLFSFIKRLNDSKETHRTRNSSKVKKKPVQTSSSFGRPNSIERNNEQMIERKDAAKSDVKDRYKYRKQFGIENNSKDTGSHRYQDREDEIMTSYTFNQKELQKGIVWSEILSKPKALQNRR